MKMSVTFLIAVNTALMLRAEPATTQSNSPPPEVSARITQGVRMRLVPPKVAPLQSRDPLDVITQQMSGVVDQIADLQTGQPVQHDQKEIVDNLDTIIQMLEKQKSGNGSSGSRTPMKPMTDSRIAGGPGGIGDLKTPTSETRNFATLAPKERDAILQSKTEGFPPGYESLLQSYYSRLAEDKGPAQANGSVDSASQPGQPGPSGNAP